MNIEQLRKDMEAGTQGDWVVGQVSGQTDEQYVDGPHYSICKCHHHAVGSIEKQMFANARRIARVPQLERIALAAEALADAVKKTGYRTSFNNVVTLLDANGMDSVNEALAAYRETIE